MFLKVTNEPGSSYSEPRPTIICISFSLLGGPGKIRNKDFFFLFPELHWDTSPSIKIMTVNITEPVYLKMYVYIRLNIFCREGTVMDSTDRTPPVFFHDCIVHFQL